MREATDHITVAHDDHRIIYANGPWLECAEGAGPSSRCACDASAAATFNFEGTMIAVAGRLSGPNIHDSLQYVLDDKDDSNFPPRVLNGPSGWLYTSPSMPYGHHTLTVRLARGDSTLFIEGMNITRSITRLGESPTVEESPQGHIPEIVGGTIGGTVGLILVLVAMFFYRRRKIQLAANYSMGPLQASLPMSKEAFTSRKYGNYGLSFTPSPPQSTDSLTPPHKHPHQPRKNSMISITAAEAV